MKTVFSVNFNLEFVIVIFFLIVVSLILVIISNNPIYSVLFLMLSFINIAILLLILGVEFLPVIFLVIYVGAISILFLFVIMMMDIKFNLLTNKKVFSNFYFISKLVLFLLILSFIYFLLIKGAGLEDFNYFVNWINLSYTTYDIKVIGFILYNFYYYYFILIGIILFVAMVGCISLVVDSNLVSKKQDLYKQILNGNINNLILFKNNDNNK